MTCFQILSHAVVSDGDEVATLDAPRVGTTPGGGAYPFPVSNDVGIVT